MIFLSKMKMESAIRNGDVARVQKLLDKGAAVDMKIRNDVILTMAVLEGQPEIFALLLERGAALPVVDGFTQQTLLHTLARRGEIGMAESLLARFPALVHEKDNMGRTPLHDAARFGHAPMVRRLIAAGAVPAAHDLENRTPYYRAKERNHEEAMAVLKGYNRYPEADPTGWQRVGPDKIIHVVYEQEIGYRITDIFNFTAAERTRICENLDTHMESSETRSFLDMEDKRVLYEAVAEMKKKGVTIDPSRFDPFSKK